MNFRIVRVPAIGALLLLFVSCLPGATALAQSHDQSSVDTLRTVQRGRNMIADATSVVSVPAAHSYALLSVAEFNLFYSNSKWLPTQSDGPNGQEHHDFEPVPPLESPVTEIQVARRPTETQLSPTPKRNPDTVPVPNVDGRQPVKKNITHRNGRIVLKARIRQHGWGMPDPEMRRTSPERQDRDESQNAEDGPAVPPPAPPGDL